MQAQVNSILKKNNLSVTAGRQRILELFLGNSTALSHGDIEKKAGEKFDRVTIYRTLQSFVEKGIIHSIPTADNSILYALCKDNCSEGHHRDNHIHFVCSVCGRTICLENITTPAVRLPDHFIVAKVEVVVNGICKDCQKAKART